MTNCRHNYVRQPGPGPTPRPLVCSHCDARSDESEGVPFALSEGWRGQVLAEPHSDNLWMIEWPILQPPGPRFVAPVHWNHPHGWSADVYQNGGDGSLTTAEYRSRRLSDDYFA